MHAIMTIVKKCQFADFLLRWILDFHLLVNMAVMLGNKTYYIIPTVGLGNI